jgi:hypothetical protein
MQAQVHALDSAERRRSENRRPPSQNWSNA